MKKVIFVIMLLIGMSIMVCSCQKDNGGNADTGKLEGKWWVAEKAEYLFNGSVAYSSSDFVFIYNSNIDKIKFETGVATISFKNGDKITSSYSKEGNGIVMDYLPFKIRSVSNNSLVFENLPYDESVVEVRSSDNSTGDIFNGKEIFYASNEYYAPYYYIGANGKGVPCCPLFEGKYWYDIQVSYFKAQ